MRFVVFWLLSVACSLLFLVVVVCWLVCNQLCIVCCLRFDVFVFEDASCCLVFAMC